MTESTQRPNWFVRVLIIIFSAILVWMVYISFTKSSTPFSINAGIITLIGIITIVILSESFNNLSVGQLISLSRQVDKTEKEKEKLSKENSDLSLQIVQMAQIVTNFRQTQLSTNTPINITSLDFAQLLGQRLGVVKGGEKEEVTEPDEVPTQIPKEAVPEENFKTTALLRSKISRKIEEVALDKYITKNNLAVIDFQKEVRFSEAFEKIDPIMERTMFFDGYLFSQSKEYFFDVRINSFTSSPMYWDRLYIMLAKILFYRQAKNIQADLTLINVEIPEERNEKRFSSPERFFQTFQPAIASNLLKIETIKFSAQEVEEISKAVTAEIKNAA